MPNLLSARRTGFTQDKHYALFEARFAAMPTVEDICLAQDEAGYHPAGYGMPQNVTIDASRNLEFVATWRCINSSD